MALETPTQHKNLNQEIKELITALTSRLGSLHRHPRTIGANGHDEDDELGVSIITLSGSNVGATMRGQAEEQELEEATTYVNSNFQAINNSIMLGGSYRTNDPGVHLDISEHVDHNREDHKIRKHKRGAKHDQQEQEQEQEKELEQELRMTSTDEGES